jgi:hypothetical protein
VVAWRLGRLKTVPIAAALLRLKQQKNKKTKNKKSQKMANSIDRGANN